MERQGKKFVFRRKPHGGFDSVAIPADIFRGDIYRQPSHP